MPVLSQAIYTRELYVGPPDIDGLHELASCLAALGSCLRRPGKPRITEECKQLLSSIAKIMRTGPSENGRVTSYTMLTYTLDVLAALRIRCDVSELRELETAEAEAIELALRLWFEHKKMPGRHLVPADVVRRALALWNYSGDDTRHQIIHHLGILAPYYYHAANEILMAADTFAHSILSRQECTGLLTTAVKVQACRLLQMWCDLAERCGDGLAFAREFAKRGKRLLAILRCNEMLTHECSVLQRLMVALRRMEELLKDEAVEKTLRPHLQNIGRDLTEWHDDLSATAGKDDRAELRRIQASYQAFLLGHAERRTRRCAHGAAATVELQSTHKSEHVKLLDVSEPDCRGVAIDVPQLFCGEERGKGTDTCEPQTCDWAYTGRLTYRDRPVKGAKIALQITFPDGDKRKEITAAGEIVRAWPQRGLQEGAGLACLLSEDVRHHESWEQWQAYIKRQQPTSR